jgi:hypothetical protein
VRSGKDPDEIGAYVLLATSCDKTLATTIAFTSIRVVCQNTLSFAQGDIAKNKRPQLKVPHSVRFDFEQIKTTLGLIDKAWTTFSDKVQKLAERPIEEAAAASFFEKLLLHKDDKSLSARARREHGSIVSLYESAPGQDLDTAKGLGCGQRRKLLCRPCLRQVSETGSIVRGLGLAAL